MKPIIYLFAFCLLWQTGIAQEWAPIGAKWHYTERFFGWNPVEIDYIKIESVKDTIVEGKTCKKLTKRHNIGCTDRPDVEYMYSEDGKVFFYDTNFSAFQILYDFSANQGDSWAILVKDMQPNDIDTLIVHVDSTNQVIINGVSLKQLFVTYDFKIEANPNYTYNSTIIESIGDLWYMFNYYPEWAFGCDANFSQGLRCYEDSIIGLYETGIVDSCEYIKLWTASESEEKTHVTLYPIPTNEVLFVKGEFCSTIHYKILNLLGGIVQKDELRNNSIPVQRLSPGIYIVEFYDSNQAFLSSQKILIN